MQPLGRSSDMQLLGNCDEVAQQPQVHIHAQKVSQQVLDTSKEERCAGADSSTTHAAREDARCPSIPGGGDEGGCRCQHRPGRRTSVLRSWLPPAPTGSPLRCCTSSSQGGAHGGRARRSRRRSSRCGDARQHKAVERSVMLPVWEALARYRIQHLLDEAGHARLVAQLRSLQRARRRTAKQISVKATPTAGGVRPAPAHEEATVSTGFRVSTCGGSTAAMRGLPTPCRHKHPGCGC
jgi:hypothetical protein